MSIARFERTAYAATLRMTTSEYANWDCTIVFITCQCTDVDASPVRYFFTRLSDHHSRPMRSTSGTAVSQRHAPI